MKWISVEERLPEEGKDVLAWSVEGGDGMWRIAYHGSDRMVRTAPGRWREHQEGFIVPITHWQPLPAPPEKKDVYGPSPLRNAIPWYFWLKRFQERVKED